MKRRSSEQVCCSSVSFRTSSYEGVLVVVYVGLGVVLRGVVVVHFLVDVVVRLVVVVVTGRRVVSCVVLVGGRVGRGSSRCGIFSSTHLGPGPG